MINLRLGMSAGGRPFTLPLDLVTQTIAILAKKGAGKSYTASVMVENLLDCGQVPVIVDPTGAWWGLKSSADGKGEGYPLVVFGGEHADLPLEEAGGEATARAIVEQRFPAILDLSLFRKGQLRRFITPFLETVYRLTRLTKAEAAILEYLITRYPTRGTKQEIAAATGYEAGGGSFNNALGALRTLELITRGAEISASENLFV